MATTIELGRNPRRVLCRDTGDPTLEHDIPMLIGALGVSRAQPRTVVFFTRLAGMDTANRLLSNMIVMLKMMTEQAISSVIDEGITIEERAALLDLEDCGFSDALLSIAHSLLSLKERWALNRSMSGFCRKAGHVV